MGGPRPDVVSEISSSCKDLRKFEAVGGGGCDFGERVRWRRRRRQICKLRGCCCWTDNDDGVGDDDDVKDDDDDEDNATGVVM